jgi:hypothetical protein
MSIDDGVPIDEAGFPVRRPVGPRLVAAPAVADAAWTPAQHKRLLNELIDERLEGPRSALTPFVCECVSPGCLRTVWLTAAEYSAKRAHAGWAVRAPVHAAVRNGNGNGVEPPSRAREAIAALD